MRECAQRRQAAANARHQAAPAAPPASRTPAGDQAANASSGIAPRNTTATARTGPPNAHTLTEPVTYAHARAYALAGTLPNIRARPHTHRTHAEECPELRATHTRCQVMPCTAGHQGPPDPHQPQRRHCANSKQTRHKACTMAAEERRSEAFPSNAARKQQGRPEWRLNM